MNNRLDALAKPLHKRIAPTLGENKYLTFNLNSYRFAVPSRDVLKIITTPTAEQGGMVSLGLVQLAQYSIQILDLPTLLNLSQKDVVQPAPTHESSFLMVLQRVEAALWGIVVTQPPDLLILADTDLQPVPTSRKVASTLKGISHVVTYAQKDEEAAEETRQVLLVLDLSALIALSQADPKQTDSKSAFYDRLPIASNT